MAQVDLSNNNDSYGSSPAFIRPVANALKANTSITDINPSENNLKQRHESSLRDDTKDAQALAPVNVLQSYIGVDQEPKPS